MATRRVPPVEFYERLLTFYSEPHRRYHNVHHIAQCLHEFDSAQQLGGSRPAVELAIWFHDAVCDPHATDNEERSADLATGWLGKVGAPEAISDRVRRLVLATKQHDVSPDVDAALIVDVDLSILGQPEERYREYETAIRDEYAWVTESVFAAKRAQILEQFLARQRLYNTDPFFEKYERQARVNLSQAISKLSNRNISAAPPGQRSR